MKFVLAFGLGVVCSLLLVPLAQRLALCLNALDLPSRRKVHTGQVPRLGGIAIYLGFLLPFLLFIFFAGYPSTSTTWLFLAATFIIFLLGILDDIYGLDARTKFPVQVLASLLVYVGGFRIEVFPIPFFGQISLGGASPWITILWLVGLCNAMNLIDGLDGLAAGISAISALTLFAISLVLGEVATPLPCILLAGSLLGFLQYNVYPAKIFMGDSGSLFLGFTLASLSLQFSQNLNLNNALLIPAVVLGVPIADTLCALYRRLLKGRHIFKADNEHFHHKLIIEKKLSHPHAVFILCGISMLLCLVAVLMALVDVELWFYALPILLCTMKLTNAEFVETRI